MEYSVFLISSLIVSLLFGFLTLRSFNDMQKNFGKSEVEIHHPRIYIVIELICFAGFSAFIVLCHLTDQAQYSWGFVCFCIPCLYMVWHSIVWKIKVYTNERYIVFRNVFLQTYIITFDELISYEEKTHSYIIYTNHPKKKKIEVERYVTNLTFLLAWVPKPNKSKPNKSKHGKSK